ncbi:MAG: zinc ABC transporter substrate-binding protein [Roseiflexaceae bacterium]
MRLVGCLFLVTTLLLSACGQSSGANTTNGKLNVVVTTQQLADAVQQVAGDRINLTSLLGPGVDPHTYVATEGDILKFEDANLIFYNGLMLEAQMNRIFEQLGKNGQIKVVGVGNRLDPSTLLNWEPESGLPYDPHIWNDVRQWQEVVKTIRDTLSEQDPTNAATYQANTTRYLGELDQLHSYILEQVQRIPTERRILVTAHDAFNYFGRAYGLEVQAIQGISTQSEASAADIQALSNLVVSRKIPAIFVESTISPRTIEAVKAAASANGQDVTIGGELFSDAMGAPGTPQATYIGMMRHNIDTIVAALAS